MLYYLRTRAKHFGFFLFGIIILAFVFWVPGGFNNDGGVQYVATVGDEQIALRDYWIMVTNREDLFRQQNGNSMETVQLERLKQDVLAGMMHDSAILQVAAEERVSVVKQEVTDAIRSETAFHENGAFNSQRFDQILRANGMDRKYYITTRTNELTKYKLLGLVDTVVELSKSEQELFADASEELQGVMLDSKLNSARVSYSEGLMSRYSISYDLDMIKGR